MAESLNDLSSREHLERRNALELPTSYQVYTTLKEPVHRVSIVGANIRSAFRHTLTKSCASRGRMTSINRSDRKL